MRLQKAPQGTPLNLVPRFMAVPTALETYALQLIYPINIASSDQTKVVPEWVRSWFRLWSRVSMLDRHRDQLVPVHRSRR
jgi:hypothetical protein